MCVVVVVIPLLISVKQMLVLKDPWLVLFYVVSERERQADRQTNSQTDRPTDRQAGRWTETDRQTETDKARETEAESQTKKKEKKSESDKTDRYGREAERDTEMIMKI